MTVRTPAERTRGHREAAGAASPVQRRVAAARSGDGEPAGEPSSGPLADGDADTEAVAEPEPLIVPLAEPLLDVVSLGDVVALPVTDGEADCVADTDGDTLPLPLMLADAAGLSVGDSDADPVTVAATDAVGVRLVLAVPDADTVPVELAVSVDASAVTQTLKRGTTLGCHTDPGFMFQARICCFRGRSWGAIEFGARSPQPSHRSSPAAPPLRARAAAAGHPLPDDRR